MRHRKLIAVLLLLALVSSATAQSLPSYKELPKLYRVNANLYRGAQPREGGFRRLAQLGIKTVINLRNADERARAEEQEVRAAGLNYFNIPLGRIGRPPETRVREALSIINDPKYQPVFVHCQRGRDRTGLIIAIYRMENEGWTSREAKEEANRHGMYWWKFGMKDFISDHYHRLRQRHPAN